MVVRKKFDEIRVVGEESVALVCCPPILPCPTLVGLKEIQPQRSLTNLCADEDEDFIGTSDEFNIKGLREC